MKNKTDYSSKPYNRCLICQHRTEKRCDGPRTSAMELARWCEYMRAMKEANGLTNAEIAERSCVSVKTIERIMAGNCDSDIMRDTCRRIEIAILGEGNQYPCYLAFEENTPQESQKLHEAMMELERALNDNEDYRKALEDIHQSYHTEMQMIRDDAQKKLDFLRAQLDRLHRDNDYLWAENNRKSRVIDTFLSNQTLTFSPGNK